LGLRLLRALGFWGISQVEFKLDPRDGQFKLMEVNARSWQWQQLSTACGVDLANVAYQDALGEYVRPARADGYGKRWVLAEKDLTMTPSETLRRKTSLRGWLKSWRGVVMDGIFSRSDPWPGLHHLGNKLRQSLWNRRSRFAGR
jgi:predicted ATP-grasp superfamily ATP-dependent carboligase